MNYFNLKLCLANLIGTVNQTDNKEINKCFRFHRRCRSLWGKRSANKILMRIVHLQKLKYDLKT
jgi:hypothetical protein